MHAALRTAQMARDDPRPSGSYVSQRLPAAFRDAPIVLERTYRQQRLIPAAMEPRAVVCSSVGGEFTIWSATQIPHILRVMLALVTGIPEQDIRVIAPDVGGGFGSKLQVTAEEVLAVLIARKLGRPVKWTELRSEGNMTVHHGRDQWQRVRIAADGDGRLRGLDVDLLADMGAYLMLLTPGIPLLGGFMFPAIYKMDAYSFKCTGIFTTKMPTDAYRGAGRPEATYGIERIMDELAAELGIDPLAVRERNWIKHAEFPFTTITGLTYDSGNYEAATARSKELFGYDELRKEQEQRRASGDPVQLGIGISTFTEMCGLAPSRVLGSLRAAAGGWEQASIRMLPTGKVEVVTGSSAHGQGHETAWSQIVSDQLGVPFEDIRVLHGDTQISPRGLDTYGSRSLAVGGMALVSACDKVIEKAKVIAAGLLEASADDLEWSRGRFAVRGDLRLRLAYPELLVDVGGLAELRGVTDAGDALVIGSRTTHYQLVRDPLVAEHCGLLAQAAATVADPAVRHRGTLGGALVHADPAGDLPAVALALAATMIARGPGGEREIPAADFFVDYLTSSLEPDEILTAVRVPKLGSGWGYRYEKFHRTAQAWATVGVAALVRRSNGSVAEARIGLTNMGPTPVRATAAEGAAAGAQASRDALRAVAGRADEGTNPPGDLHGAPDYRRHLARVLTGRALAAAAGV